MNKMKSSVALFAIAGSLLMAGGDIAPVEPAVVEENIIEDELKYYASLYFWAAGIGGESSQGSDIDVSFSDILDSLNMTYMGNVGAQKGKWTFSADIIYMDLGVKDNISNIKLKAWIVTPSVGYRVMESEQANLDLLAGARYLYMKPRLIIGSLPKLETSENVWDGIVGLKGNYDLNEKWFMRGYADIGTGESDLTWQAFAGVGYKYENVDVLAGYRYIEWEFDDSDTGGRAFNNLNMSGPIIGATYRF